MFALAHATSAPIAASTSFGHTFVSSSSTVTSAFVILLMYNRLADQLLLLQILGH